MKYRELPAPDRNPGNCQNGEIQVDANADAELPIVYQDRYIAVVNDTVRFPDGKPGHYLRIFHQSEFKDRHGTVMLARKGDEYVLLNIFRHSTRSWELECPRGFAEPELSPEENARKEILEELGVGAAKVELLGTVCPDTGMMATRAHVFLVELADLPGVAFDPREAIASFRILGEEQLMREIATGGIRDGFSLSATMMALAKGKLGGPIQA